MDDIGTSFKEKIKEAAKDVLYYDSILDLGFPRSCEDVSLYLFKKIIDNQLAKGFGVRYVRGHYINSDFRPCELVDVSTDKLVKDTHKNLRPTECTGCGCDYSIKHSWVELEDKNGEIIIVDFTSSQFSKKFEDLEKWLLNHAPEKNELFDKLEHYGKNFITNSNPEFNKYVPDVEIIDKPEERSVEFFDELVVMVELFVKQVC